jgi:hypothetical protein
MPEACRFRVSDALRARGGFQAGFDKAVGWSDRIRSNETGGFGGAAFVDVNSPAQQERTLPACRFGVEAIH